MSRYNIGQLSKIAISFKACMQVGPAEVDCRAGDSACTVHPKARESSSVYPGYQAKKSESDSGGRAVVAGRVEDHSKVSACVRILMKKWSMWFASRRQSGTGSTPA